MATQTIASASVVADVDDNEHDTDSAETEILWKTKIVIGTNDTKGAAPSIAESSEQIFETTAASPSSLPNLDDHGLEMMGVLKVTTVKIPEFQGENISQDKSTKEKGARTTEFLG